MLKLTDLHQVTQIHYEPESGHIRMWVGYPVEQREQIKLKKHVITTDGLPMILQMMAAITGRSFVEDQGGFYYRDDTREVRHLLQTQATKLSHKLHSVV